MKHTPNGPSSLSKRALCPASLSQEHGLPEVEFDEDADSGTRCHEAMEAILRGTTPPNLTDAEFEKVKFALASLNHMLAGDKIIPGNPLTESGGIVLIELTMEDLPYSLEGSPECGTVDLAIVYPDHVLMMDWKFGGSFVDHPRWNKQLMGLATGIWGKWPGREIHAAIVQPRAGAEHRIEPWIYLPEERQPFLDRLHQILIDCQEYPDRFCVGKGCQFCKAAKQNTCPGRHKALGVFAEGLSLDPDEMDSNQRARFLIAAKAAIVSAELFIERVKSGVRKTGELPDGWRGSTTATGKVRIDPNPNAPSWPEDHAPRAKKISF